MPKRYQEQYRLRVLLGLLLGTTALCGPALAEVATTGTTSPAISTSGNYTLPNTASGTYSSWPSTYSELKIGRNGSGSLTVNNGSSLTSNMVYIGQTESSGSGSVTTGSGSAVISGSGSTLNVQSFSISSGSGSYTSGGDLRIGAGSGSSYPAIGSLRLEDGARVNTNYLTVGMQGTGTLSIAGGSVVDSPMTGSGGYLYIGSSGYSGGSGSGAVTVTDAGSSLTGSSIDLGGGSGSVGTLSIQSGANVRTLYGGTVGSSHGTGSLTVSGSGSSFSATGSSGYSSLSIGSSGSGSVTVAGGGALSLTAQSKPAGSGTSSAYIGVGYWGGSSAGGTLTVTGSGSTASLTAANGWAGIGVGRTDGTSGTLVVESGGRLAVSGGGSGTNSSGVTTALGGGRIDIQNGNVAVRGSGSNITISGTVAHVAVGGDTANGVQGSLTVDDNATLTAKGLHVGNSRYIEKYPTLLATYQSWYPSWTQGSGGVGTVTVSNGGAITLNGTSEAMIYNSSTGQSATEQRGAYISLGNAAGGTGALNITSGGTVTVSNPDGAKYSGVYVGARKDAVGVVNVDGSGSSLNAGDRIAIGLDATLKDAGSGTVNVTNGGTVRATDILVGTSGTLKGTGSVVGTVTNRGGRVAPGSSPGTLTITGNYVQTSGTLELELASPSSHDTLAVSGSAALTGGTLLYAFGYEPEPGLAVKLIDAAGGVSVGSGVTQTVSGISSSLSERTSSTCNFATRSDCARFEFEQGRLFLVDPASIQEDAIEATSRLALRSSVGQIASVINHRIRAVTADIRKKGDRRADTGAAGAAGADSGVAGGEGVDPRFGVWLDGTWSRIDRNAVREQISGSLYTSLLGADYRLSDSFVVGAVLGYEYGAFDLASISGDIDNSMLTGTVFAAWALDELFTVSVLGTLGSGGADIRDSKFGVRSSGEYDSMRAVVGTTVSMAKDFDRLTVTGEVGFSYAHEWYDPYTTSTGANVTPPNARLGQLRSALEFAYDLDFAVPFLNASVEYDAIQSQTLDAAGAPRDKSGYVVGGGLRLPFNERLTGGLFASHELGRQDEQNFAVNASLRIAF